jgi:hypothetical protein
MGRKGSGTGSPNYFRCWRDRRGDWHDRQFRIVLTGRSRPYHPERAPGTRSVLTAYEYRCDCGYVGWSNHIDLARLAGDEEALARVGARL